MGACILAVVLIGLIIYSFTDKGQMRDNNSDGGGSSSSKPPTSNQSSPSKSDSKPTDNQ